MADLLECLLQIKGLQGTIERLESFVGGAAADTWTSDAVTVLIRLAEMEVMYGAAIRLMLTEPEPVLPATDPSALAALDARLRGTPRQLVERFSARRRDNLELLDGCTAEDLSRMGVHPSRRAMTLADLIAVILANDVESVGEIRRALSAQAHSPESPVPEPDRP